MKHHLAMFALAAIATTPAQAAPQSILFVGNSYTFGRIDPVMSYNTASVDDLTRPRPDLPGPNFTDSGRHARLGAASLGRRAGHLQAARGPGRRRVTTSRCRRATPPRCAATSSTPPTPTGTCAATSRSASGTSWYCRNKATRRCLWARGQRQSCLFSTYADKIEQFIHVGIAYTYRERDI